MTRSTSALVMRGSMVEVGHEFGVHLDAVERRLAALHRGSAGGSAPISVLDAGIDVGAVEGGDAGIGEGGHVAERRRRASTGAMAAGELPAAADDARDVVAGREFGCVCMVVGSVAERHGRGLGVAEAAHARCG